MHTYKEKQIYRDLSGRRILIQRVFKDTIAYQYQTKDKTGWYAVTYVKKQDLPTNLVLDNTNILENNMSNTEAKSNTDARRNWNFELNGVNQLDFEKVASTMSYANPIAFIKDDRGICHHVLVHESLLDKARKARGKLMNRFPLEKTQLKHGLVTDHSVHTYTAYECRDMAQVVAWAKEVKASQFKKANRLTGRVYIELPRV